MKVRAIRRGFFDGIYRTPGKKHSEFECPEDAFSKNWMEKLTKDSKPFKEDKSNPLEIPGLKNKPSKKTVAKKVVKKKAAPKSAKT